MVVEIQFLDKPRFAAGSTKSVPSARPFARADQGDAFTINISPSASAKAAKNNGSSGTSVFSQMVSQLHDLTSGIKDLTDQIEHATPGTANYAALKKEKEDLEKEYERIVNPEQGSGQESSITALLSYLDAANSALSRGELPPSLISQGTTLFGNDGVAFLQRGGTSSAQQLTEALRTLTVDAAALQDPSSLSRINDTLAQLDGLFNGQVYSGSNASGKLTVSYGQNSRPIELQELNFENAGEIALGLRSAKPEDLLRAASTGIDLASVNQLILKPHEDDPKRERDKRIADANLIELTKKDSEINQSSSENAN